MTEQRRMNRRQFLAAAGGSIAAAALLSACGGATPATPATSDSAASSASGATAAPTAANNTAPAPATGDTVLLVRPDIKPAYAVDKAIERWNAQFSHKITMDEAADTPDTKIQAAQAAGDLIWSGYAVIATPWETQQYVKRKLIQPLDDMIKASTVADANKVVPAIIPTILESSKYDGKQYVIPGNVGSIALAWQTDAFKAAGIESQPQTWNELHDAAKKIKAAKPNLTPFDVAASPLCDLYAMIWGAQENPVNADGLVDITGDASIEALQWLQTMVKEGLMPPVHKESFGNWLKGGTGMILSYDVAGTVYQQTFGKDSAQTGTTIFKNKGQTMAGVPFWMNAVVVLNKAKNPQNMTDFYLWWFGPNNKENGKQMTEVAAKPCYEYTYDEFVKNDASQAWQLQGIDLIRKSKPFNVNSSNNTEQIITGPYVEKVLDPSQNIDPKQAMQNALDDIKAELKKQK